MRATHLRAPTREAVLEELRRLDEGALGKVEGGVLVTVSLTPRERSVLHFRFELDASLARAGKTLKITRERARQIECAALRKLGFARKVGRRSANPKHPFARWLGERRRTEVAEELEVSVSTVNRLAAGDLLPSILVASRIAKLTGGKVKEDVWAKHRKKQRDG